MKSSKARLFLILGTVCALIAVSLAAAAIAVGIHTKPEDEHDHYVPEIDISPNTPDNVLPQGPDNTAPPEGDSGETPPPADQNPPADQDTPENNDPTEETPTADPTTPENNDPADQNPPANQDPSEDDVPADQQNPSDKDPSANGDSVDGTPQNNDVSEGTEVEPAVVEPAAGDPPPDFGVLGYDLNSPVSTDGSLAKGSLSDVVINEVCAKSKSSLADSDGDYPDWIELYNLSDEAVSLEGAGLSDDPGDPLKWVFPSVNIQPKSRLVIFCSDKNTVTGELHTNFKISSGNEQLILSAPDKNTVDSVIAHDAGEDITYGRYPDGSDAFALLTATPGSANDGVIDSGENIVAAPVFSKESGFYGQAFSLTITADPGSVIYYTTDGSLPTTTSEKYSSPIEIKDRSSEKAVLTYKRGTTVETSSEGFPTQEFEKAVIIRAIAVGKDGSISNASTATYFVGKSISEKYKNVTVISVVSDPDDLYNQKDGIYVAGDVFRQWRKENPTAALDGNSQANFNQRGREWEREAHVDFFRGCGLEFSEDCGVRTHGGWSRNSQQKSLKFYMRSDYGESKLKYELFEDNRAHDDGKKIKEYKRYMIRNGGNDSFVLLFKDPWTQACLEDFPLATQASDIAICFLDGEYWGIYTLNEVYDDNYVEENYGVAADNVVMMKAGSLEEGADGDEKLWQDTERFIKTNDMSDPSNYEKACGMIDMKSFCEYIAAEIYIGNEDWIWNNWACWRAKETGNSEYQDGRWRFMVYDTEYSMDLYGSGGNYRYDVFTPLAGGDGHLGPIVKSLLASDSFRSELILALEDAMNIAFNPDSAAELLDEYYRAYSPYIEQHFRRFVFWQTPDGIRNNVEGFKKWLRNRYNYMPEQIADVLSLSGSKTNTLSVSLSTPGGEVRINGIPIKFTNGKWEGHYFPEYKITIEAVPYEGYEFTGWSGGYSGSASSLTINPKTPFSLIANFTEKGQ